MRISTLRTGWLAALLALCLGMRAQLPPEQPEQDCFGAISVCEYTYFQPNSYTGAGENSDEINGAFSCMLIGERNSVWYTFTVQSSGLLCFTLFPTDSLDDYDWALYNVTNASCADIPNNPALEVRCNWTFNSGCQGRTGANSSSECLIQNEACVPVNGGETFMLNVSNFTGSQAGYLLDLSQSTATLFDDIPPQIRAIRPHCEGVTVVFSENVICSTVDSLDFSISGPGGPYGIAEVRSRNCAASGDFGNTFDLIFAPARSQPGLFTIALTGSITDQCGNPARLSSTQISLPQPPVAGINTHAPQCLEVNRFGFAYSGPSQVSGYAWDFGDGAGSPQANPVHSYQDFGTKTVTLAIIDQNGCRDTATREVVVLPAPLAQYGAPDLFCQGAEIAFSNQSQPRGGSGIARFVWRFGDGTSSNAPDPTHVFRFAGPHFVQLEVFNELNCRDTFNRLITVFPAPEVNFLTEADVCFGDTANLLNLSSIRNDIASDFIESWTWDLGNGDSLGSVEAPAYVYGAPGDYAVVLRAVSDKGCADSLTKIQPIYQPPIPDIEDGPVCFGLPASLVAAPVPGGLTLWYRAPGDTAAFHRGPVYYTPPVIFDDVFYVETLSKEGCYSERAPVRQRHFPLPNARIRGDSVLEFPEALGIFSVEGDLAGQRYAWGFGDGGSAQGPDPVYEYAFPGLYTVRVVVTDENGCEHELTRQVEVKNVVAVHVPSAFTPNGDGFNDEFFVAARLLREFRFALYSRTGEEIFSSSDPGFRWDGIGPGGKSLPEGVYTYRVEGYDFTGNRFRQQGSVTLLR